MFVVHGIVPGVLGFAVSREHITTEPSFLPKTLSHIEHPFIVFPKHIQDLSRFFAGLWAFAPFF